MGICQATSSGSKTSNIADWGSGRSAGKSNKKKGRGFSCAFADWRSLELGQTFAPQAT
jgi:hypothetical protein